MSNVLILSKVNIKEQYLRLNLEIAIQNVTEQDIHINKSLKHNPSSLHDITILNISHKNFTFVLILSLSLQNTHETAAGN